MAFARKLRWARVFHVLTVMLPVGMACVPTSASAAQATAGGNAAEAWRRAFPLLTPIDAQHNPAGLLTAEEWEVVQDSSDRFGLDAGRDDQVRVLVAKLQPAFDALDEAAAQRKCDFGLDRSQGFALLLPHLSKMRQATRVMRLKAEIQLADGDLEGMVRTQSQMTTMALQPGQDQLVISALVGQAMTGVALSSIRESVDQGALNQEAAKQLLEGLAPLRATDPFGMADAIRGEYGTLELELRNAVRDGMDGDEFLRRFGSPQNVGAVDPAAMLQAMPSLKPIFELQAQAALEPDEQKSAALARKAGRMIESLQGPAAGFRALIPALDRLIQGQRRTAAEVASLVALLKRLAEDPDAADKLRSPALLWARVAARVDAIPDDRQDAIALILIDGPKEGDPLLESGVSCLQGCRDTILADMALAARLERKDIDFSQVRGVNGSPPFRLLGGMRGAARLALADMWLLDAEDAVDRLELAAAAVQALSADPHQASSCMAMATAKELVPAVRRLLRTPGIGPVQRERVQKAIDRIDRTDPFGFKASLKLERERLASDLEGRCEPSEPDELRKALRQRPAGWVLSAWLESRVFVSPLPQEPGTLVDVADIFLPERVDALREACEPFEQAIDPPQLAPDRRRPSLRDLPVPVLRDTAVDAAEAQAVLSQLDAALRGE